MTARTHHLNAQDLSLQIRALTYGRRGPARITEDLRTWAENLAVGDPACLSETRLQNVLGFLVVLSLANTGFQVGPAARSYPPQRDVEMHDLGGAFAALAVAHEVLEFVRDPEQRAALERFMFAEYRRRLAELRQIAVF